MSLAPLKTTTALVASLALLLQPTLATTAWAQAIELLCRDDSAPPCPEGEPEAGSTPAERAAFAASEAARIAAEAADTARELRDAAGMPPLKWSTHWDMFIPISGGPKDGWKTREARRYRAETATS